MLHGIYEVRANVSSSLLANQNTAVSHLSVAEGFHGIFDTTGSQGEGHGGGCDLLLGRELDQGAKAVTRGDQGALDTDTLDVQGQKGHWGSVEIDSERVDGPVDFHQGDKAVF